MSIFEKPIENKPLNEKAALKMLVSETVSTLGEVSTFETRAPHGYTPDAEGRIEREKVRK